MPTPTYDLIASNVLTSSAQSVSFTSIPATYRDLLLIAEGVSPSSVNALKPFLRFNNASDLSYSWIVAEGNGTSTASELDDADNQILILRNGILNGKVLLSIQIMDYSATDKHKSVLIRANSNAATNPVVDMIAGRWASTSAINQVTLFDLSSNAFQSGSTFYLYGIVS